MKIHRGKVSKYFYRSCTAEGLLTFQQHQPANSKNVQLFI